jgi:SAM-dependent methyltransferase
VAAASAWLWPLTALACWAVSWAGWAVLQSAGLASGWATAAGLVINTALGVRIRPGWRAVIVVLGWPLSLALLAPGARLPPWAWLLLLAVLLALYPLRAWRDAPWYPTPRGALAGLAALTRWRAGVVAPRILDAGCGQGAGLRELRREYPAGTLVGVEWSWSLWLLCRWRCGFADVQRADLWAQSWADFDLVYLFQRPETLARALAKAQQEMRPGSWLASLEFGHADQLPAALLRGNGRRAVWLYRISAGPTPAQARGKPPGSATQRPIDAGANPAPGAADIGRSLHCTPETVRGRQRLPPATPPISSAGCMAKPSNPNTLQRFSKTLLV